MREIGSLAWKQIACQLINVVEDKKPPLCNHDNNNLLRQESSTNAKTKSWK